MDILVGFSTVIKRQVATRGKQAQSDTTAFRQDGVSSAVKVIGLYGQGNGTRS